MKIKIELVVVVDNSPKEEKYEEKDKPPTKNDSTKGKQSESKQKMSKFKFEGQTEIFKKTVCSCI